MAWLRQTEYFSSRGYRCLRFDNRGIGKSSAPKQLYYTTKQMAQDALELINHVGFNEFHIVGISMGGMIAQELALLLEEAYFHSHYQRVLSLTLIATHCGGINARVPIEGLIGFAKGLVEKDANRRITGLMKLLYHKETMDNPQLYNELLEYHNSRYKVRIEPPLNGVIAQVLAVAMHHVNHNRLLRLRFANYPILVVVGTADKLVREYNSVLLSRVLGAELLVLNNIGHGVTSEAEKLFNAEAEKHFIASKQYREQLEELAGKQQYNQQLKSLHSDIVDPESAESESDSKSNYVHRVRSEYQALSLACQHNPACFVHCAKGALQGAAVALLLRLLHKLVAEKYQLITPIINPNFTTKHSVLLLGSITGLLRTLFCVYNGLRSRLYMQKLISSHFYQSRKQLYDSYRNKNPLPQATSKYKYIAGQRYSFPTGFGLEWPVLPGILAVTYVLIVVKEFQNYLQLAKPNL
jgi:pimeloyl-ACP methyl ester carboxylesterase